MSKQANKTAIGVFVVGAVVLAAAAIVIFGSGKFFTQTETFVAYFHGSVKGLRVGAPVMFRGVRIGQVTKIQLYSDYRDLSVIIPVIMQIDSESFKYIDKKNESDAQHLEDLIEKGLRAQLQMQSLVTGQLVINIDVVPNTPVKLRGKEGIDLAEDVVEIPTIETSFQKIEKTFEDVDISELAVSIKKSLEGIEGMVNSPEIPASLKYLRQTLKDVRNLVRHLDEKIDPLFADVDQTVKEAQVLLQNIDSQVDPLAGSIKSTSDDARKLVNNLNKRVRPIQADLAKTTKSLRVALETAGHALQEVDGMVSENSDFRYQIDIFLREITLMARSLRTFADYLDRNPDALLRGKVRREGQK
jgi:paraquat-inducible protein B